MTDHNDTGATARPWRFVPSHVAEGPSEVRSPEGWLICTTSSDVDAALIERAVNEHESLKARLAEVEKERDELKLYPPGLSELSSAFNAAEARIAVLEKVLAATLDQYISLASSGDCGFWDVDKEPHVIAARAALAEQKEVGK